MSKKEAKPQSRANPDDIVKAQVVELCRLQPNKGQIPGVPKNPRFIRDDNFRRLCRSIEQDPEMTELRELLVYPLQDDKGSYVVIAGNMRLRAMRENGVLQCPCKVIKADATAAQLRAYAAKDNVNYGKWDFDIMANEWDPDDVAAAGIDIPDIDYDTGEKPHMKFRLTTAQAAVVLDALAAARKAVRELKEPQDFGNTNTNANAFFYAVQQSLT